MLETLTSDFSSKLHVSRSSKIYDNIEISILYSPSSWLSRTKWRQNYKPLLQAIHVENSRSTHTFHDLPSLYTIQSLLKRRPKLIQIGFE